METNTQEVSIDRELLRESRRKRRKLKKEQKRVTKEKEKALKTLELKYGRRDTHVTLVTKEFANNIASKTSRNVPNTEINDNDFPILGQAIQSKSDCSKNTEITLEDSIKLTENTTEGSSKRTKTPIILDLNEIISNQDKVIVPKERNNPIRTYEGNILDSSQPERKRGKHREIPKRKIPSKLKSTLLKEKQDDCNHRSEYIGEHNPRFEIYCDNLVTEELDTAVSTFLKEIVTFQEKLYKRDPLKGACKRRYVVGFHEIKKFLKVNKLQLIIIAPNIQIATDNGALASTIKDLQSLANVHETPYVFALSRRIMGRICLKKVPISCIGILDHSGAQETFKKILELISVTREMYANAYPVVSKDKDEVLEELNEKVINALK